MFTPISTYAINWHVPVYPLSTTIEQHELSIFRNYLYYINQNNGAAFHYFLNVHEGTNTFEIKQNTGQKFILSNITDLQHYDLQQTTFPVSRDQFSDFGTEPASYYFNKELFCHAASNYGTGDCISLNWNHQAIYSTNFADSHLLLGQAVVSADNQWLLLQLFTSSFNQPDQVYLLDLRSLDHTTVTELGSLRFIRLPISTN